LRAKLGRIRGKGNLERINVADLKKGMFVAELDRPWLETPFPLQGFELKNESQRRFLEEYCKYVYIDTLPIKLPNRPIISVARPLSRQKKSFEKKVDENTRPKFRTRSAARKKNFVSTWKELRVAKASYQRGKSVIDEILNSARFGQMLNTDKAEGIVSDCVESMLRDPGALLWMSKIKHEDEYTAEHCLNVCILAIAFGRHLGFTDDKLKLLGMCGLLHDVGKMRTPDEILNKTSSLTDEEFVIMKQHTTDGYHLLVEEGGAPEYALDVALCHHERPDGRGYPNGLVGEDISEYSRIIAIVDAYDAMTSNRCYTSAVSAVDALKVIYRNRGKQFDEEYALSFMQAIGPYPPGSIVELYNGMVGIVLSGRRKSRHLPTTIIVRNAEKEVVDECAADLCLTSSGELDNGYLIRRSLQDGSYGVKLEDYQI